MKKFLIVVALVASVSMGTAAYAFLDNLAKPNLPFPFDVKVEVKDVVIVPSGNSGDGSYYLIFGYDVNKKKDRIIEIQTNTGSMFGNVGDLKEINRDYTLFKVRANIGKTITFECNGFDNIDAVEEYPQCYKVKEIS